LQVFDAVREAFPAERPVSMRRAADYIQHRRFKSRQVIRCRLPARSKPRFRSRW
jgi:hypothetical protein